MTSATAPSMRANYESKLKSAEISDYDFAG